MLCHILGQLPMMRSLAPIALFAFNRPQHLYETIKALKANDLADCSDLYVYVDGPHATSDRAAVEEVKSIVDNISGFKAVHAVFRDRNMGLARSITSGVTELTQEFGRVIVLEDDIVTSRGFLTYMNDALNLYENDSRVFQITGYMVPNKWATHKTGFLRIVSSWGWGTWERAWLNYESDASSLLEKVNNKSKSRFDLDGYAYQSYDLKRNANNELNTWAVKWYASVFLNDGLCLYPKKSMLKNIGLDGSGTNCGSARGYKKLPESMATAIEVKRIPIEEDQRYLKAMQAHYARLQRQWSRLTFGDRVVRKIQKVLANSKD
ncbi:hypothetical protein ACFL07_03340 [Pseudomonadota bacterium]